MTFFSKDGWLWEQKQSFKTFCNIKYGVNYERGGDFCWNSNNIWNKFQYSWVSSQNAFCSVRFVFSHLTKKHGVEQLNIAA